MVWEDGGGNAPSYPMRDFRCPYSVPNFQSSDSCQVHSPNPLTAPVAAQRVSVRGSLIRRKWIGGWDATQLGVGVFLVTNY